MVGQFEQDRTKPSRSASVTTANQVDRRGARGRSDVACRGGGRWRGGRK
jgi:hypothetical protein